MFEAARTGVEEGGGVCTEATPAAGARDENDCKCGSQARFTCNDQYVAPVSLIPFTGLLQFHSFTSLGGASCNHVSMEQRSSLAHRTGRRRVATE
jgi:hypothetical protein